MFYTNAFVNLNLPATVLFLLSRTSHGDVICIYVRCASRHLTDDSQLCAAGGGDGPQHFIWPTSQLLLIPGQTSGAGYREIPPFSNILWILWLIPIPNWLGAGKCVWRHECETWLCTLKSDTEAGWVRGSVSWILEILWRWHVSRWMWPVWTSFSLCLAWLSCDG